MVREALAGELVGLGFPITLGSQFGILVWSGYQGADNDAPTAAARILDVQDYEGGLVTSDHPMNVDMTSV